MTERILKSESKDNRSNRVRAKIHNKNLGNFVESSSINNLIIQREATCACGGGCPNCQAKTASLPVSQPNDASEIEADQIADKVMRETVDDHSSLKQNYSKSSSASNNPKSAVQPKNKIGKIANNNPNTKFSSSNGNSMDKRTRSFMQNRFGTDFSDVKIHTDTESARMSRELNARAFTIGNNIFFDELEYQPDSNDGKRLLAHELVHTLQNNGNYNSVIHRYCSNPDFCKPYSTKAEADSAEWWLRNTYFRAEGVETYGTDVKDLYERFLSRSPGDSLSPKIFSDPNGYVVSSFRVCLNFQEDSCLSIMRIIANWITAFETSVFSS